jgi:CelD/BcsL family acetyltransferase involved in cellulose biosynthesis
VDVSLIHPSELGPAEIAAWHAMQRDTPSLANPFLSPEFAMAVGRFRPGARVAVLTEGQSITGFFPFERRQFSAGVPICGWLTPCQGVIHAPGAEWDPRELLRGCRISAWRFDNLIVDQKPFVGYHSAIVAAPLIDLSDGFESYYAKVRMKSPRFWKEIARRARKLEREFGELRVVADSRDPVALRTLLAWKSEKYRQTSHVDRFEQPWLVALLDTLQATRGAYLSGALSALYAGDQLVAAQFGLRTQNLLVGWFTGYESSLRKYSPGLIHIKGLAEEMAAAGLHTIDMGGGAKNYYKEMMKSDDSFVAQGVVTNYSMLGIAHHARSTVAWTARRAVREHPRLHRAADELFRRSGLAHRIYGRILTSPGGASTSAPRRLAQGGSRTRPTRREPPGRERRPCVSAAPFRASPYRCRHWS